MGSFSTENPATGKKLKSFKRFSSRELRNIIDQVHAAQAKWKTSDLKLRQKKVLQLSRLLKTERKSLALLMTQEMGKPLKFSLAEIDKCALLCEEMAKNFKKWLAPQKSKAFGANFKIRFDASGVSLGIMPWNFPAWQVFRYTVPSLLGGNGVLLKHAEITTGSALKLEEIFKKIFGTGLFRVLIFSHDQTDEVIQNKKIHSVSFTGSTEAGRKIAEICGRHLKKSVLELGGNDPYLILKDADPAEAAKICVRARMVNTGQSCIAGKRFYVHEGMEKEFIKKVEKEMDALRWGDPSKPETDVGPLAGSKFAGILAEQIQRLEKAGFQKIYQKPFSSETSGTAFFPPMVFLGKSEIKFDEELFGPVMVIATYKKFEQAMAACNDSSFGLGSSVLGKNKKQIKQFEESIEAGFVAINTNVQSNPRFPFGGLKDSGYGRELSQFGFYELLNVKTVCELKRT